jgi:hypothetical protein
MFTQHNGGSSFRKQEWNNPQNRRQKATTFIARFHQCGLCILVFAEYTLLYFWLASVSLTKTSLSFYWQSI